METRIGVCFTRNGRIVLLFFYVIKENCLPVMINEGRINMAGQFNDTNQALLISDSAHHQ